MTIRRNFTTIAQHILCQRWRRDAGGRARPMCQSLPTTSAIGCQPAASHPP